MPEPTYSISTKNDRLSTACMEDISRRLFSREIIITDGSDLSAGKFSGKAQLWNLDCAIESIISPSLVLLCAQPSASGWSFGDCFPQMPGAPQMDESAQVGDTTGSAAGLFLGQLGLEDGLLIYAYAPAADGETLGSRIERVSQALPGLELWKNWAQANEQRRAQALAPELLENGMLLAGNLTLSALKGPFGSLLKDLMGLPDESFESKIPAVATIEDLNSLPKLKVRVPLVEQVKFGPAEMEDAHIALVSPIYPWPEASQVILDSTIKLMVGENACRFRINAELPLDGNTVIASASLLGGELFSVAENPLLPALKMDELLNLELAFNIKECQLERISFAAQVKDWNVLPEPFKFRELALSVILYPQPAGKPVIIASFMADVLLDTVGLTFSGFYPSGPLTCSLDADTPLKLRTIGRSFGFAEDFFPDVAIKELGFSYDFHGGGVSGWLRVSSADEANKTLGDLPPNALEDLHFRFQGPAPYSAEIGAQFRLNSVTVTLSAKYAGGWQFEGSTGPGQDIQVGEFIADLAGKFGTEKPQLPSALTGMSIKDLNISFSTNEKKFKFGCKADLPISESSSLEVILAISAGKGSDGKYQFEFDGQVNVQMPETTLEFKLQFEHGGGTDKLLASYHQDTPLMLNIPDLLVALARGDAELASMIGGLELRVGLQDIQLAFKRNAEPEKPVQSLFGMRLKALMQVSDTPVEIDSMLFAAFEKPADSQDKKTASSRVVFGLKIGAELTLSRLPLLGKELPNAQAMGIKEMQLFAASQALGAEDATALGALLPECQVKLPEKEAENGADSTKAAEKPAALDKGVTVTALLLLGSDSSRRLVLSPSGSSASGGEDAARGESGTTSSEGSAGVVVATAGAGSQVAGESLAVESPVKWIKIEKQFGPIYFDQIGIAYEEQVLSFMLDASISAAGLTISFDGLEFGTSISEFKPSFDLKGLGINFKQGQVEIGGAFLKSGDGYSGRAVLKIGKLSLMAMGAYTNQNGQPSMFIYAVLDYPLGGLPVFYVTGLAAGFGYHRALLMPPISQVAQYPLVAAALGSQTAIVPSDDPGAALKALETYLKVENGQYFLAAGVKFTSFKMVESFAMLAVSFGQHLEVNILGLSTIKIPFSDKPSTSSLSEIQVAIKASFIPDNGFVGVMAQLTPSSYLLSKDCHPTGGLAFYSWFAGDNAGDFVLTVGGYHPKFSVPPHYPQVPPLAVNWQVNSSLLVKGSAYFALTPSMLMAGLNLEASWRSGGLEAWFNARLDFLIGWKPFFYRANVFVSMGVAYTFRIDTWFGSWTQRLSANLGTQLQIWGPEFSGTARISLSFITFDIKFGAGAPTLPASISWDDFRKSFLPEKLVDVSVSGGLIGEKPAGASGDVIDLGILDPRACALVVDSSIPVKALGTTIITESNFGIAPMGRSDVPTVMTIKVSRDGQDCTADFDITPITKKVPAGLWGTKLEPDMNAPAMISVTSGFELKARVQTTPAAGGTDNLSYDISAALENTPVGVAKKISHTKKRQVSRELHLSRGQAAESRMEKSMNNDVRRQTIKKGLASSKNRQQDVLAALGFGPEAITINDSLADAFAIAPQIETLKTNEVVS